jgi:hypothetical protein
MLEAVPRQTQPTGPRPTHAPIQDAVLEQAPVAPTAPVKGVKGIAATTATTATLRAVAK